MSAAPKSEQLSALTALLADREQVCMDLLTVLTVMPADRLAAILRAACSAAVIPTEDLMTIIRAAAKGWERDAVGYFHMRVDKPLPRGAEPARPAVVRLQAGEEIIGPERRKYR